MCRFVETSDGMMPVVDRRYVDNTLNRMQSADDAVDFLTMLSGLHPTILQNGASR